MKHIIFFFALLLWFASCKKADTCPYSESGLNAPSSEITYLAGKLAEDSIAATQHSSGVFYNITQNGTGSLPGICSNITVKYTGSIYPSGVVFDSTPASSQGISFTLGQLIVGWQKILPLIKTGGKVTLYVPPTLGYGANAIRDQNGNVVIPASSYLKFDIELVNVQ